MYLLVPAHLGCPGQSPESHKMVVVVVVIVIIFTHIWLECFHKFRVSLYYLYYVVIFVACLWPKGSLSHLQINKVEVKTTEFD